MPVSPGCPWMRTRNLNIIKATLGGETNARERVTMRNEGLGRTAPKETKKNKNEKKSLILYTIEACWQSEGIKDEAGSEYIYECKSVCPQPQYAHQCYSRRVKD